MNVLRTASKPATPAQALERFQHDLVVDQYLAVMGLNMGRYAEHSGGKAVSLP